MKIIILGGGYDLSDDNELHICYKSSMNLDKAMRTPPGGARGVWVGRRYVDISCELSKSGRVTTESCSVDYGHHTS